MCAGNICRSPAAEGFIASYFKDKSPSVEITSAGIQAMVGDPAVPNTQKVMLETYGIDVSHHRARQVTEEMMRHYDLILVMDDEQALYLKKVCPFASGKIYRLGKWRQTDIADPYKYRDDENVFRSCIALIHDCVDDWIKKFW